MLFTDFLSWAGMGRIRCSEDRQANAGRDWSSMHHPMRVLAGCLLILFFSPLRLRAILVPFVEISVFTLAGMQYSCLIKGHRHTAFAKQEYLPWQWLCGKRREGDSPVVQARGTGQLDTHRTEVDIWIREKQFSSIFGKSWDVETIVPRDN